MPQFT
jgi:hypothetical protein